jgi:glycopeptide antibiotics resistance protein
MTTAQLTALHSGLIGFLLTWPVVLLLNRARRPLASGAVTLYACLALAVVLLPLPGPNSPRLAQTIQLVPFQWVLDIPIDLRKYGWSNLGFMAFEQMVMNVLLFVPLGLFARMLWRRSLRGAVLIGFGCSLLIEITQLTGNFGTAPFAYRVFDVDDLITNTVGSALGWVVAAVLVRRRVGAAMRGPSPARDRVLQG